MRHGKETQMVQFFVGRGKDHNPEVVTKSVNSFLTTRRLVSWTFAAAPYEFIGAQREEGENPQLAGGFLTIFYKEKREWWRRSSKFIISFTGRSSQSQIKAKQLVDSRLKRLKLKRHVSVAVPYRAATEGESSLSVGAFVVAQVK